MGTPIKKQKIEDMIDEMIESDLASMDYEALAEHFRSSCLEYFADMTDSDVRETYEDFIENR